MVTRAPVVRDDVLLRATPSRTGLARSIRLWRAFRVEQSDPDRFYRTLADDTVRMLGGHVELDGATVLDVGGGPGYFDDALPRRRPLRDLDADAGEMSALDQPPGRTVLGGGMRLPFADGAVDVCLSSNVLEHVSEPWVMAQEMLRVTRPGGTTVISFTVWHGPWGGHETSPWHYLGGLRARRRYVRRHGREPKNRYGESLFAVGAGEALRWAGARPDAHLAAAFPRYHPRWSWWILRIPARCVSCSPGTWS